MVDVLRQGNVHQLRGKGVCDNIGGSSRHGARRRSPDRGPRLTGLRRFGRIRLGPVGVKLVLDWIAFCTSR